MEKYYHPPFPFSGFRKNMLSQLLSFPDPRGVNRMIKWTDRSDISSPQRKRSQEGEGKKLIAVRGIDLN